MPIGPQPRGARGTIERPYSALRLRLGLAIGGLVICVGRRHPAAGTSGSPRSASPCSSSGAMALVDMVVISVRLSRGGSHPPGPPPPRAR